MSPLKFSNLQIRNKFIYETLIRLPRKIFIPNEFYTNDVDVLLEILEKHPFKILPENFDTLVTSRSVADAYVKWFLVHHQEFPEIMKLAHDLSPIFQ